jgi:hypothetical protein
MHITQINNGNDLAGGGRNESVVIVGVAINDAAAKAREKRKGLALEKIEEMLRKCTARWIGNAREKFARPEGASNVPFEIALCGGVRKIEERGIDFRKETAERGQKFGRVRCGLRKCGTGEKGQDPDEAPCAIGDFELGKKFSA